MALFAVSIEKPKISYILEKKLILSITCSKCRNECEKTFKEKNPLKYKKLLV